MPSPGSLQAVPAHAMHLRVKHKWQRSLASCFPALTLVPDLQERWRGAKIMPACAQNTTSYLSEPIFNNSFPPGPANFINTNFRLASEVVYPLEILWSVRSCGARTALSQCDMLHCRAAQACASCIH